MTMQKARLILAGLVALAALNAAKGADAALILAEQPSSGVNEPAFQGELPLDQLTKEFMDAPVGGWATPVLPAHPPEDNDHENHSRILPILTPASGMSATGLGAQSNGPGPTGPAMIGVGHAWDPANLEAALPEEAKGIFPTGPPFSLFRPPRGAVVGKRWLIS